MYHSEASPLPDSRVLVSRLDPWTPGLPEELRIEVYSTSRHTSGLRPQHPASFDGAESEHRLGVRWAVLDLGAIVPGPADALVTIVSNTLDNVMADAPYS